MDLRTQIFLVALMVIVYVVGWRSLRPVVPKLGKWMSSHQSFMGTLLPLVLIVWGAGVWYLIVATNAYRNIFAMIMASILIGTGIYLLVKLLFTKA